MSDPTLTVLSLGFVSAFALAAAFAMGKAWTARPLATTHPRDPDSPYQSPAETNSPSALPPDLPEGKVPVWFYRPLDLLGAAFVFAVFTGLVILSLGSRPADTAAIDPAGLLVNIAFQFVMAGLVCLMVCLRVRPAQWLGLRWKQWPWVFLIAPGAVLSMWLIFGGLHAAGYMKWMETLGVETVQDTVQLLQKSSNPLTLGLMAFAAVIAAPLCEEIVFRGYFYPVLKRFAGVWPAAVSSALFFSCAHGSLTAALPLFLFGGLLVFLYEKTGSLWAPVAVHFCFNGATVVIQMAARFLDLPIETTT